MFNEPLQTGLFAYLSELTLGATVYDDVPQPSDSGDGSRFPYVTIGDAVCSPFDTDDSDGADCLLTLHVWSRKAGRKECKTVMDALYGALHGQSFDVEGFSMPIGGCSFDASESFLDSDGKTRHGVIRFRVLLTTT